MQPHLPGGELLSDFVAAAGDLVGTAPTRTYTIYNKKYGTQLQAIAATCSQ